MFTAYKHSPVETSHQVTLQGVVYQLDVALEDEKTQRAGIVFIYNMSSSKYSNFDYELSQKILGLLKGAYPARLKKVLIVTAPLWFKAPFRILRLFVREKLRDRVFMLNVTQLPLHIPRDALPYELGGKLTVDHHKWITECHKVVEQNKNELCDLASYNKFPLITNINNGIIDDGQNGSGRLSDDDELSSNDNLTKSDNTNDPANGNHVNEKTGNSANSAEGEGTIKRLSKLKPEKIIMPTEVKHDLSNLNGKTSELLEQFTGEFLHADSDEGITIEEFIQYMKDKGRKGLYDEYSDIKAQFADGTFDNSRSRSNQHKNRYTDVLCYDHSRVFLSQLDDDPSSDYINANYVDGYMQKRAFISTQGPLQKTSPDFWRMIWEQDVVVIVMTTRTVERCRAKCHQYWPLEEESSVEFDQFKVCNNGVEQFTDYIISSLVVSDSKVITIKKSLVNKLYDYFIFRLD